MATITWKGEPDGPDENTWGGKTFKKGEAVEVDDERMLEKAKNNPYYEVKGYTKSEPNEDALKGTASAKAGAQVPPSQQPTPQYPASKGLEPRPETENVPGGPQQTPANLKPSEKK